MTPCPLCHRERPDDVAHVCPPVARDPIGAPSHYTWHPSGIQPKDFVGEFTYNVGTAMVYEWRAGRKEGVDAIDDLRKAITHLRFEIERIERRTRAK